MHLLWHPLIQLIVRLVSSLEHAFLHLTQPSRHSIALGTAILPDRKTINSAYLALGIAQGLTAAITDPTVPELRNMILACDLLMGYDD